MGESCGHNRHRARNRNAANCAESTCHSNAAEKSERIAWIDIVRGLSILGVLFFHFGPPGVKHQIYPGVDGVTASQTRMWRVSSEATTNPIEALLLMSSGLGFHVQLFLVVSGFVLAFTDMHRAQPLSYAAFMRRRTFKLLPLYYAFVLLLGIIGFYESRRGNLPWIIGSSREDLPINLLLGRNFSEAWVWIYPGPLWCAP